MHPTSVATIGSAMSCVLSASVSLTPLECVIYARETLLQQGDEAPQLSNARVRDSHPIRRATVDPTLC